MRTCGVGWPTAGAGYSPGGGATGAKTSISASRHTCASCWGLASIPMRMRGFDSVSEWAREVSKWRGRQAVQKIRGQTIAGFYRRIIDRGDLVFDVGANHGVHVNQVLRRGGRGVAIEPQGNLALELERRFPGATVLRAAAGSAPGIATLVSATSNDLLATLNPQWQAASGWSEEMWDSSEPVEVIT